MVQPQANGSLYSYFNKDLKKSVHTLHTEDILLKSISRIIKIPYLCINNINIKNIHTHKL